MNKTILVVEDEEVIRETLQLALQYEGYAVVCAANGREALDLLATMQAPGLIFLDLMMPVMNGWEFVEELYRQPNYRKIPIVLVTAYSDQVGALKATVKAVIPKPVDLTTLYGVARKWYDVPGETNG